MVIATQQRIQIITEYIQKGAERMRKQTQDFNKGVTQTWRRQQRLGNTYRQASRQMNMAKQQSMGYGQVMKMNQKELSNFNQAGYKFGTIGGRMANRFRMATHGLRGFRMEMLGVMFFGMMLNRTFGGLLKTSLQWVGATEIMTLTMGILFLPVALDLLKVVLWINKKISAWSDETKRLIGWLVVGGAALGAFLFIVGTFALGLGSLILVFGALATPIGIFLGLLGGLAVFLTAKWLISDFGNMLDSVRGKVTAFGVSGEAFDTFVGYVKTGYSKVVEFLIGLKDTIGTWIGENLPKFIEAGGDLIMGIITGIKNNSGRIVEGISLLIDKISIWLDENIDEILQAGADILGSIVDGIANNLDTVENVIIKIIDKLNEFITNHGDEIFSIGLTIAKTLVDGIVDFFQKNPGIILGAIAGGIIGSLAGPAGTVIGATAGAALGSKQTLIQGSPKYTPPSYTPSNTVITPSGPMTVAPTYNVVVSDKREFEDMLRDNNNKLAEDVRRLVQIR